MNILVRVKNKIKDTAHKVLLGRLGFGNRVPKQIWEEQFGGDAWDYLTSKDEEEHYRVIVEFYRRLNTAGTILDIGCGKGVLYSYFKNILDTPENRYTGIDISENAVNGALQQFPNVDFKQVDFDYADVNGKFDVIIFNETLYYFNRPLKTLEKCIEKNLKPGGCFIISMCDYSNHDLIWTHIAKQYKTIFEEEVVNDKNQKWKVKLVRPSLK